MLLLSFRQQETKGKSGADLWLQNVTTSNFSSPLSLPAQRKGRKERTSESQLTALIDLSFWCAAIEAADATPTQESLNRKAGLIRHPTPACDSEGPGYWIEQNPMSSWQRNNPSTPNLSPPKLTAVCVGRHLRFTISAFTALVPGAEIARNRNGRPQAVGFPARPSMTDEGRRGFRFRPTVGI